MHYLSIYTCLSQTTDQRFPDAEFRIEYSSTLPDCVGSSQAQDVASVVYSCLDESAITIIATYMDSPDCTSDTVTVQIPQPPLCMCDVLCMLHIHIVNITVSLPLISICSPLYKVKTNCKAGIRQSYRILFRIKYGCC